MPLVKLLVNHGEGYARVLDEGDAGLNQRTVWDSSNNFLVELSEEESDSLLTAVPGEFVIVEPDDETDSTLDDLSAGPPQESVNDSQVDGKIEVSESPESKDPDS